MRGPERSFDGLSGFTEGQKNGVFVPSSGCLSSLDKPGL